MHHYIPLACDYLNPSNVIPAIIIVIKCNQIKEQRNFWPDSRRESQDSLKFLCKVHFQVNLSERPSPPDPIASPRRQTVQFICI